MISFREHHRLYDGFFRELCPESDNSIDVYYDQAVMDCDPANANNQIAMLLEPRSMIGDAYEFVGAYPHHFRHIFTHDSNLLTLPNAHELNWANVWLTTDSVKNKSISLCTSYKNWCPLHNLRLDLANYYKDRPEVDVFYGDWNNPDIPTVEAKDYLEHYKFSIVVENDIDDYWYTEKILNCFATKTVPIYIGAKRIGDRFNENGVFNADSFADVTRLIDMMYQYGLDSFYQNAKIQEAIEDNFYRCVPYKISWKDRFIHKYGHLLEEMLND